MDPALALVRRREPRRESMDCQALLWSHLRGRRLGGFRFRRHYPCGPFVLDFFCPARRLAIAIDGGPQVQADGRRHDRRRSEFLAARGIALFRFGAHQIRAHTDAVLATIAFALGPGDDRCGP